MKRAKIKVEPTLKGIRISCKGEKRFVPWSHLVGWQAMLKGRIESNLRVSDLTEYVAAIRKLRRKSERKKIRKLLGLTTDD